MNRPEIEEFKRLCGIETPFWGMADSDVIELCDYILQLEAHIRDLEAAQDDMQMAGVSPGHNPQ